MARKMLIANVVYNTAQIGPITQLGGWKNGLYSELKVIKITLVCEPQSPLTTDAY